MDNNNNFDTDDLTGSFDTSDIEQNKAMGIISYIPMLFLVALLAANSSSYAKFHANQGLILTVFSLVCSIINGLLGMVIGWIPVVGAIACKIVSAVLGLLTVVFIVVGIVNAAQGKAKKLPVIGGIFEVIK